MHHPFCPTRYTPSSIWFNRCQCHPFRCLADHWVSRTLWCRCTWMETPVHCFQGCFYRPVQLTCPGGKKALHILCWSQMCLTSPRLPPDSFRQKPWCSSNRHRRHCQTNICQTNTQHCKTRCAGYFRMPPAVRRADFWDWRCSACCYILVADFNWQRLLYIWA